MKHEEPKLISRRRLARTAFAAVAAIGALLSLAGCGSSPGTAPTPPSALATSAAQPASPSIVAFGQTYKFDDGSTITMTATKFTPKNPAQFGPAFVLVKGTITNGGAAPARANNLLDATSNGQPAQLISLDDPAVSLPSGELLPGQSQTFAQPYAVKDNAAEFVVTVSPPLPGPMDSAIGKQLVYFHGSPS